MNMAEQRAILTLCLMAAFADGGNSERERAEIRRIADTLDADGALDVSAIYQEVLLRKPDLAAVAAAIAQPNERQFAYEMAVCVCDADGATSPAEREFLGRLAQALGLDAGAAQAFTRQADALTGAPLEGTALDGAIVGAVPANAADLDGMILNYSILNGALELLPQSLASMAIIPLQMKMVYRVGKAHGFELDRGHIKDLLATMGVGLTSQYVEQIGRKLLGGLLGKIGGGLLGGAGSATTGAAFSFASTYALGHVAKRYYAGGRTIDAAGLQQAFTAMLGEAKQLQGKYTGQIAEQARTLDVNKLLSAVRESLGFRRWRPNGPGGRLQPQAFPVLRLVVQHRAPWQAPDLAGQHVHGPAMGDREDALAGPLPRDVPHAVEHAGRALVHRLALLESRVGFRLTMCSSSDGLSSASSTFGMPWMTPKFRSLRPSWRDRRRQSQQRSDDFRGLAGPAQRTRVDAGET